MTIQGDINKLVDKDNKKSELPFLEQPSSISEKTGNTLLSGDGSGSSSGSGIDSPLTEVSRDSLDFQQFDDFNVWSVNVKAVVGITMIDASGRSVTFNYSDPEDA